MKYLESWIFISPLYTGYLILEKLSPKRTNHTLPTNGFASAYSGVSLESFQKNITFQKLEKAGLKNISSVVTTMAAAEGLDAHGLAVKVRVEDDND